MIVKSWFKHHVNCRNKDQLSQILQIGGTDLYGKFWVLVELYGQQMQHRKTLEKKFTIAQSVLFRELKINERSYNTIAKQFETLSIRFRKVSKTVSKHSYNVIEIYAPKLLIFFTNDTIMDDIKNKIKIKNLYNDFNGYKVIKNEGDIKENISPFISKELTVKGSTHLRNRLYYPSGDLLQDYTDIRNWLIKKKTRPSNITEFCKSWLSKKYD